MQKYIISIYSAYETKILKIFVLGGCLFLANAFASEEGVF